MLVWKEKERLTADPIFFFQEEDQPWKVNLFRSSFQRIGDLQHMDSTSNASPIMRRSGDEAMLES